MVQLQNRKPAGVVSGGPEQIKLLAGTRNQLFRTPFSTFVHVAQ
ncbi:uncharacterized protein METZ01_LOCUS141050 [marine metagenome]|uniref:Uncharacterized protein n=1 Tax=marine metagenome TaxID=408172 RepID=A0A381ZFY1_9ZZZZ